MKRARIIAPLLLLLVVPSNSIGDDANDQSVLVWNGRSMTRRTLWALNGKKLRWQFWLYKKGSLQTEQFQWGVIEASTIQVLRQDLPE
jgi:hypothetical protein